MKKKILWEKTTRIGPTIYVRQKPQDYIMPRWTHLYPNDAPFPLSGMFIVIH